MRRTLAAVAALVAAVARGCRCAAGAPGSSNIVISLHSALALAQQANVRLHLGAQASMIADAGIATGHDDPRL